MRFYSMGYFELLEIPIYTFWELSKNVDRIRADEDKRTVMAIASLFGDTNDFLNSLNEQRGVVAEAEQQKSFDKNKFNEFKALVLKS